MKKMTNRTLNCFFFLSLFIFSVSCDLTPRIHKEILRAQELIEVQRYGDAAQLYEKIILKSPNKNVQLKIFYQLGELYSIHLAKHRLAIVNFEKVKEVTEDPLWLVKSEEKLGEIKYTYLKDYESSKNSYERLVNFKPRLKNVEFYEDRLVNIYISLEEYEKAQNILANILSDKSHKYYIQSYFNLAIVLFHQEKWNRAIHFFKEFIKVEKRRDNIVQAKFLMANCYETLEQLKTAYNIYYSILGEYPNTEVIQNRLNSIYGRRVSRKR
jgi:tetratricopeptide (TPR) repeat protein